MRMDRAVLPDCLVRFFMINYPLISVIVPAYNAEKWIAQACNSVFEQTYPNWQLIVVDDGSRDSTYEILQAIAGEHSTMNVIHTENGGVCKARNIGLDKSQGEYIVFLDADDLLATDALEKMYNAINTQQADIVAGARDNITSKGGAIGMSLSKRDGSFNRNSSVRIFIEGSSVFVYCLGKAL